MLLLMSTFQSRRDSARLFINTTYYIAIAVHKLDNNNLHYNYAQNKQTNKKKKKKNYVASVRLDRAVKHLLQLAIIWTNTCVHLSIT